MGRIGACHGHWKRLVVRRRDGGLRSAPCGGGPTSDRRTPRLASAARAGRCRRPAHPGARHRLPGSARRGHEWHRAPGRSARRAPACADRKRDRRHRGSRRRTAPHGVRAPARRTKRARVTAEASPASEARFDELIHPSTRLSIVALLASADWIDFAFVRDRLELSDSALSKQFATLEAAGYISVERPVSNHRRRVQVRLTETGRAAFEGHIAALRAVVATSESTTAAL